MRRREPNMRAVAIAGWILIVGVLLLWQGFALAHPTAWPTMSQLFRDFMRIPVGRPILFALWLWFGWHLFARGVAVPRP
jgi:uncharacterized protein DUF6186